MKGTLLTVRFAFIALISLLLCHSCSLKKPKARYEYKIKVSQTELVSRYSGWNKDSFFNASLKNADSIATSGNETFLQALSKSYRSQNLAGKLSTIFAGLPASTSLIAANDPNEKVISILDTMNNEDIRQEAEQMKHRIDLKGWDGKVYIATDPGKGIISIKYDDYEGIKTEDLRKILTTPGRIEFWNTYENEELITDLADADKALGNQMIGDSKDSSRLNPIFRRLSPNYDQQNGVYPGPAIGRAFGKDTALINRYFGTEIVRSNFPRDAKFLWSKNPINTSKNVYEYYALKTALGMSGPTMEGNIIADAQEGRDQKGNADVLMTMNSWGTSNWARMTAAASNSSIISDQRSRPVKRCIAIVMDNQVFSAPRVMNAITGGNTEITGIGNEREALDMALILKAGALKANVTVMEEKVLPAEKEK